ncbi:hypothetical protein GCM10009679_32920 [Saccharothrix algeriensis]|uniref:Uncharacterized protein n=1 Tax=Catellatospora bangladeshensis TaxID=310355 RepID=A0A8J3JL21_9ACTN|nr:hypothetical protein Cba03nite_22140 [Catellatospora bangladeshensis]
MSGTSSGAFSGDLGKWLALAGALAALGLLPKAWQKAISAAGAAYVIAKML